MSPSRNKLLGLVADANVLIDYARSDESILMLISHHVGTVHIPSPVFEEVHDLSGKDITRLDIKIVEPTLEQVLKAQAGEGRTSFQDRLCFVVAQDAGWSVLTNDTALRNTCSGADIPCLWGMEAMAMLVKTKHLPAERAMAIAERIASINSFITDRVLEQFRSKICL